MTLDNFEKSFPANRLKNGLTYFRKGKVSNLEEDEEGDWLATVSGTEDYDVEIYLKGRRIDETSCTCVSHEKDGECKHVAAVLYAINHEKEEEKAQKESAEAPADILSMLDDLREDELRTILKISLKGNEALVDTIKACGPYFLLCHGTEDLSKALTKKIDQFQEGDAIDKKHWPEIITIANTYVEAAETHWKKKELKQAIDYLLAVIDVLPFEAEFIEDEEGAHRAVIRNAFQLIDKICTKEDIGESLSELLSDRAFTGAVDINLPFAHYELHWLDLILRHNLAADKAEDFVAILDELLAANTEKSAEHARLLRIKIDFLGMTGQKGAALKLVQHNPDLANEKEQLLLAASGKKDEYKIIRQKMLAELELARVNNDAKQYADLQKLIIELMMGKSDVLELRKLAEQFYRETGDPFFFDAMKDTYIKAEWEQVKKKFVSPGNGLRKV